MNRDNTALLILSCDKYADLWQPFFDFLFKFWSDCPYKIYLGTNEKTFDDSRITTLKSGVPLDWSADTLAILSQIEEKYVIVLLEDYFVYAKPDQEILDKGIRKMDEMSASFLRLACFPSDHFADYAYDEISGSEPFVLTRNTARYRVNLQAGIWNRKLFMELIRPGETPWAFEVDGTKRSAASVGTFLGIKEDPTLRYVHGPIPYLCSALTRGVWMRDAIELCKENSIALNTGNRSVESIAEYRKRKMYHTMPYGFRKYWDYIASKLK